MNIDHLLIGLGASGTCFLILGSIVSGTVGAIMGSNSQDKATNANRKNARDTNAANLLTNLMMRGGAISAEDAKMFKLPQSVVGKSSALLPYYLNNAETEAGSSAADISRILRTMDGTPDEQAAAYQNILQRYQPAFDANDKMVIDIGNGNVTDQMLRENQPVSAARMDVAQSKKNAGLESLKATLNQIDAIQARKGYVGDSFGNRLLKFNAQRAINTQGAADIGGANLENAMDVRGVQGQGRSLRLNSLTLPDSLAQAAVQRRNIPGNNIASNFNRSLQPLQFFNIGPGAASQSQRFQQDPSASPWQLLAQAGSAAGNTAANYFLQNQLQKNAAQYAANQRQNAYSSAALSGTEPGVFSTGSGGAISGAVDYSAPAAGAAAADIGMVA